MSKGGRASPESKGAVLNGSIRYCTRKSRGGVERMKSGKVTQTARNGRIRRKCGTEERILCVDDRFE